MQDKAELLGEVCRLLASNQRDMAASLLIEQWPFERPPQTHERAVTDKQKLDVFFRDHFTCRYCGNRTVFAPTLQIISLLLPDAFPMQPYWKRTSTHPAFWELSTSHDHILPISRGGTNDRENLVTVCYQCQDIKGHWTLEELRWVLLEPAPSGWDGLTGVFQELVDVTGSQTPSLKKWRKLLADHSGDPLF